MSHLSSAVCVIGGRSMTYALRLTARNVRGIVQLSVETRNAAIALGREWARTLGAQWTVEVVDSEGVPQWRI